MASKKKPESNAVRGKKGEEVHPKKTYFRGGRGDTGVMSESVQGRGGGGEKRQGASLQH